MPNCESAKLHGATARLPDETTILRFRHVPEKNNLAIDMLRVVNYLLQYRGLMLRSGMAVDATLISSPSSAMDANGERDPEIKQAKRGNNQCLGMKANVGVDIASGSVHTVATTPANVHDVNVAARMLHGDEQAAFGDTAYKVCTSGQKPPNRLGMSRCAPGFDASSPQSSSRTSSPNGLRR